MFSLHLVKNKCEEGMHMGNPKKDSKHFVPNHIGTKSRAAGNNNGKQMADKTGKSPDVIQTKGE